jgi:hypothetical protein
MLRARHPAMRAHVAVIGIGARLSSVGGVGCVAMAVLGKGRGAGKRQRGHANEYLFHSPILFLK